MSQPQEIRVAVIYEPDAHRPKPIWFELRGDQYRISEVCYFWRSWDGEAEILSYSVMTPKGLFELAFNTKDQSWQILEKSEG